MAIDYIVENGGTASNWYKIWNSGWKECGGILPPSVDAYVTCNFPFTFTSMPTLNVKFSYGNSSDALYQYLCPRNITTSSFQIKTFNSASNGTSWRAEGY